MHPWEVCPQGIPQPWPGPGEGAALDVHAPQSLLWLLVAVINGHPWERPPTFQDVAVASFGEASSWFPCSILRFPLQFSGLLTRAHAGCAQPTAGAAAGHRPRH